MSRFWVYHEVLSRLPEGQRVGQGLSFCCPFGDRHGGQDRNPSAFVKIGERGELVAHCNGCGARWPDFVKLVGLPPSAWWPQPWRAQNMTAKPKPVEEYAYTDEAGELVAVKVRYEPGFDGRRKSFLWKRPIADGEFRGWAAGAGVLEGGYFVPCKTATGAQQYRPSEDGTGIPLDNCKGRLSLYRLPDVVQSRPEAPIVVVEGERKANVLASLGFVATSGYAGKGKWLPEWGCWFTDRRVCIIPDWEANDAGQIYAHLAAASAIYYGAAEIRIAKIPLADLNNQPGDILDWLEIKLPAESRPTNADRFRLVSDLCKRAKVWK